MATRSGTRKFGAAAPDGETDLPPKPAPPSNGAPYTDDGEDSLGAVPDLLRKMLGMGLSGFFLTESTIRKAVGDAIPKDWVDFAVDQSDRTRAEVLERLSFEVGRSIENIDFAAVLERLMDGRTLEINAKIRLGSRSDASGATKFRVSLEDDEEGE